MNQQTLESMNHMKLRGMHTMYESVLQLPVDKQPEPHALIAQLVDAEHHYRQDKRMHMYIRLSKMRYAATIMDIHCTQQRNISKEQLIPFMNNAYITRAENIAISGSTGCGKSYLACAIGHQACVNGHRTLYLNMNRFVEQIALAKLDGTLIKWMDRIAKTHVLILDDFGLQPLTQQVKLTLLQIMEDRYAKYTTIICSQLPVKKWFDYIYEPALAQAVLDRFLHKVHRSELEGFNMRKS